MNVLFLAAEASPFASTGGLGDVIASLPLALISIDEDRLNNINCRVLLPAYQSISLPSKTLKEWRMDFDGKAISVVLKEVIDTKFSLFLLDIPEYFARNHQYGYEDDILRFGAFCQAALLVQKYFQEEDWDVDVIHCHDWHTALFPVYKNTFGASGKVLLTIHNLAYQGVCKPSFLPRLGLPPYLFNMHQLEFWEKLNPLKGGIAFADAISTVSPRYAKEIQTPENGCGLEDILRDKSHKLFGVINGIDYNVWNPQKDVYLKSRYSAANSSGKADCKHHLQKISRLKADSTIPLIGMVTRLTEQKGIDLLISAFEEIMRLEVQLVILGDGEQEFIEALKVLLPQYKDRLSLTTGIFDTALAHQIYAGSDLFLMPSRFEPCGLAQMISMRYGTIPIVRATGGLADTVQQFSSATGSGNGWLFESYTPDTLIKALRQAVDCYKSKHWNRLQQNAFDTDFSWHQSALEYKKIYLSIQGY